MTTISIETYCPNFPGMYNTLYEMDTEGEISSVNQDRESEGKSELEYSDFLMKPQHYMIDVSKAFCSTIETMLKYEKLVSAIKFESIYSPREYNFSNDTINCEIELTDENRENLHTLLTGDERDNLTKWLKERFESRDGFCSFYSSEYSDWEKETNGFRFDNDRVDFTNRIGAIFDFIFEMGLVESDDEIYDKTMENICVGDYCYYEGDKCSECGHTFDTLVEFATRNVCAECNEVLTIQLEELQEIN